MKAALDDFFSLELSLILTLSHFDVQQNIHWWRRGLLYNDHVYFIIISEYLKNENAVIVYFTFGSEENPPAVSRVVVSSNLTKLPNLSRPQLQSVNLAGLI